MKNKKLSESLDRSMADVSWKEQNRLRVWNGIRNAEPARSRAPRRISVVIAFALVLVLGMATALAAFNEDVNQMLYQWWPEAALALRPVNLSFEEAGIRLDVLSASVIDDEMLVTFTLTDLVGDGRINETTECMGALLGDIASMAGSSTEMLSYDPEKRQATYAGYTEFTPVSNPEKFISNGMLDISIHGISNPRTIVTDLIPLMSGRDYPVEAVPVPFEKPAVIGTYEGDNENNYPPILNPDNSLNIPLTDGVVLSGMGWIDGVLHVQTYNPNYTTGTVIHFLSVYDRESNDYSDLSIYADKYPFHVTEMGWMDNNGGIWYEDLFPFSPEEMENYAIRAEITEEYAYHRELADCEWTVEFPASMIQIKDN